MRRHLSLAFLFLAVLCAAALDRQSNADYRTRREALANKMGGGIALVFATEGDSEGLLPFRQDEDYFYLTGLNEPGGAVLMASAQANRPYTEILFLPARNLEEERWTGPKLSPESPDLGQRTGFERVLPVAKLAETIKQLNPKSSKFFARKNQQQTAPFATLQRAKIGIDKFEDAGPLLASLRMVKDGGEIDMIRKATEASMAAHVAAMHAMRPGIPEREIAGLMQYEMMKRGCEGLGYVPIVGSGTNSTVLHYSEDSGTVQSGDVVVIDVGGSYSNYVTDITRTLPASGKFTPRQREIYDIVLGAQDAAIRAFQAGKASLGRDGTNSLYNVAYDYINTHGKDRQGNSLGRYFTHGLGHHVGLNVHDPAEPGRALDRGMVFTLEPGIYIPEEKLGVRIEDMFWIDASGKLVQLTAGLPRTAEEVERAMAEARGR